MNKQATPEAGKLPGVQVMVGGGAVALQILEAIRATNPDLIADNLPEGWGMNRLRQELGKLPEVDLNQGADCTIMENGETLSVSSALAGELCGRGLIYRQHDNPAVKMYHIVDAHSWSEIEKAIEESKTGKLPQIDQEALADRALAEYDFGPGVEVIDSGKGGWEPKTDFERTRKVYVETEAEDDGPAPRWKLTFTVRFHPADGSLAEASAIDSDGKVWGSLPRKVPEAQAELIQQGYSVKQIGARPGKFRWWLATGGDGVSVPQQELSDDVYESAEAAWSGARLDAENRGIVERKVPELTGEDIAFAKAAGFQVHLGTAADGEQYAGRWWWSVSQPGWSEAETSHGEFDAEQQAWQDAVLRLREDPELLGIVAIDVVIPARDPKFASQTRYTAGMRVARVGQAMKAWRVADDSSEDVDGSTEPDDHAVVCMLADLRHYCDAHGLDYAKLDRGAYADYREQLGNDRLHEKESQASSVTR